MIRAGRQGRAGQGRSLEERCQNATGSRGEVLLSALCSLPAHKHPEIEPKLSVSSANGTVNAKVRLASIRARRKVIYHTSRDFPQSFAPS